MATGERRAAAPLEAKAVAGPSVTLVAGYAAWAVLTFVPGAKTAIPADLQGQLPVIFATVLSAIAAYYVPHTQRPDVTLPAEPRRARRGRAPRPAAAVETSHPSPTRTRSSSS